MYFIYILRCADDTLYCGQTKDLTRRLDEHNTGLQKSARYTRGRRPVKLVYFEEIETLSKALRRELEIKSWSKSKKELFLMGEK